MSSLMLSNKEMYEVCRSATLSAYEGKVDQKSLAQLMKNMEMLAENPGRGIEASANMVSAVIWSKITCEPKGLPWIFDEQAWGLGVGGGSCAGIMYHAYEDQASGWDYFFEDATAYHAQGIASVGGIFQITWFRSDGAPIGQFNGAMAGAGAFEMGNSCKWRKK